jgi:phage tail sheath gpL-like
MNRNFALAIVLAASAVAGSAFADDITIDPARPVSTVTRSETIAQLAGARSAADLWTDEYNLLVGLTTTSKTRAEVTAEYIADRDEVAAFTREDSGSSYMAQKAQPASGVARFASVSE